MIYFFISDALLVRYQGGYLSRCGHTIREYSGKRSSLVKLANQRPQNWFDQIDLTFLHERVPTPLEARSCYTHAWRYRKEFCRRLEPGSKERVLEDCQLTYENIFLWRRTLSYYSYSWRGDILFFPNFSQKSRYCFSKETKKFWKEVVCTPPPPFKTFLCISRVEIWVCSVG